MPKKNNIYTAFKGKDVMKPAPKSIGNDNFYTAMGLKPRKVRSSTCPNTSNKK